eukprot:CAMPEP_0204523566 /NCGR_PEP_ID=MMETSP0661-20131031/6903_1 /ASSEMBLY_ACC=CAM_ASM_000606 /TAXON_ID=109239 /ORGANISM="Alexandrium margalefi, Strain AMGDE01CS-322" /LENGTH=556 /DNA_ID=CAMNT_0051529265 /DNA_START=93 /DNA_END=1759 /DNA_ORIENTATION=+
MAHKYSFLPALTMRPLCFSSQSRENERAQIWRNASLCKPFGLLASCQYQSASEYSIRRHFGMKKKFNATRSGDWAAEEVVGGCRKDQAVAGAQAQDDERDLPQRRVSAELLLAGRVEYPRAAAREPRVVLRHEPDVRLAGELDVDVGLLVVVEAAPQCAHPEVALHTQHVVLHAHLAHDVGQRSVEARHAPCVHVAGVAVVLAHAHPGQGVPLNVLGDVRSRLPCHGHPVREAEHHARARLHPVLHRPPPVPQADGSAPVSEHGDPGRRFALSLRNLRGRGVEELPGQERPSVESGHAPALDGLADLLPLGGYPRQLPQVKLPVVVQDGLGHLGDQALPCACPHALVQQPLQLRSREAIAGEGRDAVPPGHGFDHGRVFEARQEQLMRHAALGAQRPQNLLLLGAQGLVLQPAVAHEVVHVLPGPAVHRVRGEDPEVVQEAAAELALTVGLLEEVEVPLLKDRRKVDLSDERHEAVPEVAKGCTPWQEEVQHMVVSVPPAHDGASPNCLIAVPEMAPRAQVVGGSPFEHGPDESTNNGYQDGANGTPFSEDARHGA